MSYVKPRGSARRAFTLIELLVVIAIIALLLAILLPSLSKAKELALRATCGQSLNSLGKAVSVYSGDFDGKFPKNGNPIKFAGNWYSWVGYEAFPYMGSNMETAAADYLINKNLMQEGHLKCPAAAANFNWRRKNWWGGVWVGSSGIQTDFTYWSQTVIYQNAAQQCIYDDKGNPLERNYDIDDSERQFFPLAPWYTRRLGESPIYGAKTDFSRLGGYGCIAKLNAQNLGYQPLFSDITHRIAKTASWGYDDWNHGKNKNECYVNSVYSDGHVEGHSVNMDSDTKFIIVFGWGSEFWHFR
jgi:prepilin-type N-terminal cleavage/methylation domain-containing protein